MVGTVSRVTGASRRPPQTSATCRAATTARAPKQFTAENAEKRRVRDKEIGGMLGISNHVCVWVQMVWLDLVET